MPKTVSELKDMGHSKLTWARLAPAWLLRSKANTYATQRALNAGLHIDDNLKHFDPLFGKTVQDTLNNFTNKVGVPYLASALSGSGAGAVAGAAAGSNTPKFEFDDKGAVTPESQQRNAGLIGLLAAGYKDPKGGAPLSVDALRQVRTNMANTFAQSLGFKPGTTQYDEWVKYFVARGEENYNKFRSNDLLKSTDSQVPMPSTANDEQKAQAGLFGTLMASRKRPADSIGITT